MCSASGTFDEKRRWVQGSAGIGWVHVGLFDPQTVDCNLRAMASK